MKSPTLASVSSWQKLVSRIVTLVEPLVAESVRGQMLVCRTMQKSLQSAQPSCRPHLTGSLSVNVRSPCPYFSPRPHTLCRTQLRCHSYHRSFMNSRSVRSNHERCRAVQPDASIDQDADLVGEDAAFFDVEKQTTKSWTLFTGLLLGVLGLIYVVGLLQEFTALCTSRGPGCSSVSVFNAGLDRS